MTTLIGLEIVVAVSLATAAIAALQSTAPAAGLGIVYLLAVLTLAIRRGELAALVTSLLSVLTLNYLFITPRHQLTIAHSQDLVELIVLLIASVVVGRLAAVARQRAAEAERRAGVAAAHEREAELLGRHSRRDPHGGKLVRTARERRRSLGSRLGRQDRARSCSSHL